jgi:hypothetical protein
MAVIYIVSLFVSQVPTDVDFGLRIQPPVILTNATKEISLLTNIHRNNSDPVNKLLDWRDDI